MLTVCWLGLRNLRPTHKVMSAVVAALALGPHQCSARGFSFLGSLLLG